ESRPCSESEGPTGGPAGPPNEVDLPADQVSGTAHFDPDAVATHTRRERAFQLEGPGGTGADAVYFTIAMGEEVHASSFSAFCRPTSNAQVGRQAVHSDFRFGGDLAALGREPIRSGGRLRPRGRSEAVLCSGWGGPAHVVPSRPPRQLDT